MTCLQLCWYYCCHPEWLLWQCVVGISKNAKSGYRGHVLPNSSFWSAWTNLQTWWKGAGGPGWGGILQCSALQILPERTYRLSKTNSLGGEMECGRNALENSDSHFLQILSIVVLTLKLTQFLFMKGEKSKNWVGAQIGFNQIQVEFLPENPLPSVFHQCLSISLFNFLNSWKGKIITLSSKMGRQ